MISLRHRAASGTLENLWEFDPTRGAVMCVVRGVGFDVPVCLETDPQNGRFVLTRLSEDVWRISPAFFRREGHQWATRHIPFPDSGGVEEFIALTHTPVRVRAELEDL